MSRQLALSLGMLVLSSSWLTGCGKTASSASSTSSSSSSDAVLESMATGSLSSALSSDSTAGNLQILAANEVLPAGVTDIVLGVSAIDIHTQNGSYVNVSSTAMSLDLATLTSSVSSLVQATVAAGNYDKVRLTFSSISVSYENGDSMSYDFSSSSSSASDNQFVAALQPVVALSSSSVIHLLVDVGAVAKAHGMGCGSSQQPSAHSELLPPFQIVNLDTTGSLSGLVSTTDSSGNTTVLANAVVTVVLNGQPVAAARSDAEGNYFVWGLAAGSYTVYVGDKGYAAVEIDSVAVAVAATTTENATLTVSSSSSSSSGAPSGSSNGGQQNSVNPPAPPWEGGSNFDHP